MAFLPATIDVVDLAVGIVPDRSDNEIGGLRAVRGRERGHAVSQDAVADGAVGANACRPFFRTLFVPGQRIRRGPAASSSFRIV